MPQRNPVSVRVECDALPSDCEVRRLEGEERISRPFRFELEVVSQHEPDPQASIGAPLHIVFGQAGIELRRVHGIVTEVRDPLNTEGRTFTQHLTVEPRVSNLVLNETSEVFVGQSIPFIVQSKLERLGMAQGEDFQFRLLAPYQPRDFVVQYRETTLSFISRLTEHWGIFWFFEHADGRDVLVFTDHNDGMRRGPPLPFYERGDETGVFTLASTTQRIPARVVVKDYNYRTPHVPLIAQGAIHGGPGEIIEYGGHFKTPNEGERLAGIRAEELLARRRVFQATSAVVGVAAGGRFLVEGHPRGDIDLAVVAVTHHLEQAVLGAAPDAQVPYRNQIEAIESAVAFRPQRVTPKPRVSGVITGNIEAEAKDGYAELDDEGRYRVRFKFDTSDAADGKASHLVRMAQPHAGPGYGFHFPLRHGVEVLLTCIDGDPDRPVISSAVANPMTPSTVAANNGRRNVIRTGGGNEINIDDTKGAERIKLTCPHGGTVFQLGAPNMPAAGAAMATNGGNMNVAGDGSANMTTDDTTLATTSATITSGTITNFAGAGAASAVANAVAAGLKIATSASAIAKGLLRPLSAFPGLSPEQAAAAQAASNAADTFDAAAKGVQAAATPLLNRAAKAATAAAAAAAKASATSAVAAGNAAAGGGRVGTSIPAIAGPAVLNVAVGTSAAVGAANAFVGGTASAAVASPGMAVVAGVGKAAVKSPAQAELWGGAKALVTSGALVDVKSSARLKVVSGALSTWRSASAMVLQAATNLILKAPKVELKGKSEVEAQAPKVKVAGTSQVDVVSGSWGLHVKPGKTMIGTNGTMCVLEAGQALLKQGGDSIACKGGVAVKGSKVSVNGAGGVKISGSRVELG